jgi:hypothetical protein
MAIAAAQCIALRRPLKVRAGYSKGGLTIIFFRRKYADAFTVIFTVTRLKEQT